MYPLDLSGKVAAVFGVANDRSIAWSVARMLHAAGAKLALSYQNDRLKDRVSKLADTLEGDTLLVECDVSQDDSIDSAFASIRDHLGRLDYLVHSIAFANRDDLGGDFSNTGREGFRLALEISAFSLIPLVRGASGLMSDEGGSVVAMTFQASERVFPGYNIMGTAKAALENEVRQLAAEYGNRNIRVNAISAGPLETLAARGIQGFLDMKKTHAEKAPLGRNITHDEVAKTALFLCSDMASGITGSVVPVDAGYHIMAV